MEMSNIPPAGYPQLGEMLIFLASYCVHHNNQLYTSYKHPIIFTGNSPLPPPQQYQSPPGYDAQQYPPATEPQTIQVNSCV